MGSGCDLIRGLPRLDAGCSLGQGSWGQVVQDASKLQNHLTHLLSDDLTDCHHSVTPPLFPFASLLSSRENVPEGLIKFYLFINLSTLLSYTLDLVFYRLVFSSLLVSFLSPLLSLPPTFLLALLSSPLS